MESRTCEWNSQVFTAFSRYYLPTRVENSQCCYSIGKKCLRNQILSEENSLECFPGRRYGRGRGRWPAAAHDAQMSHTMMGPAGGPTATTAKEAMQRPPSTLTAEEAEVARAQGQRRQRRWRWDWDAHSDSGPNNSSFARWVMDVGRETGKTTRRTSRRRRRRGKRTLEGC